MMRYLAVISLSMVAHAQYSFVRVQGGQLRGQRKTSALGKGYHSFQGIPYAKPPLRDLRFKDAQEPEAWNGTRDALQAGCKCTQYDREGFQYGGCEDCLFLNVYTSRLPEQGSESFPVMLWIHGGGFVFGSGKDDIYGPDYLVAENIVLVTINYRLSCLGFLFLNDAAPGNVGLKDQVAALRWVKKNIAAFNGDPDRVTIFGESAGGTSAHLHMLSPMSKGLFHGAIAESGAAMNSWEIQYQPYNTSLRLARAVGCTDDDDDAILECLRTIDHLKLVKAAETQAPTQRDRDRLLLFSFTPTFHERKVPGVETFVVGPPEQLIRQGCQHDVPYMTGVNDQEWMLTYALNVSVFKNEETLRILDSDWKKYICPETEMLDDCPNFTKATEDIRQFYLNSKPLTSKNLQGYKNILTDLQFGNGIHYGIKYMAKSRKSDYYMYSFRVDQVLNFLKNDFNMPFAGASHADDLGYLFHVDKLPNVTADNPAFLTRKRVIRLWTNFAKYGKPTTSDDPLIGLEWKPYTSKEKNYLEIGSELKMGKDPCADRYKFWDDFYKKYGSRRDSNKWMWMTCSSCSVSSFFSWIFSFFT